MLGDFSARLCDIDLIYRRTLAEEQAQEQPVWWKRLWNKFWRRHTSDAARAMNYMATLDEAQVIDIASRAVGGTSAVHARFRDRHGLKNATRPQALSSQLQEVVIHGPDLDVGALQPTVSQSFASSRRDSAGEGAVSAYSSFDDEDFGGWDDWGFTPRDQHADGSLSRSELTNTGLGSSAAFMSNTQEVARSSDYKNGSAVLSPKQQQPVYYGTQLPPVYTYQTLMPQNLPADAGLPLQSARAKMRIPKLQLEKKTFNEEASDWSKTLRSPVPIRSRAVSPHSFRRRIASTLESPRNEQVLATTQLVCSQVSVDVPRSGQVEKVRPAALKSEQGSSLSLKRVGPTSSRSPDGSSDKRLEKKRPALALVGSMSVRETKPNAVENSNKMSHLKRGVLSSGSDQKTSVYHDFVELISSREFTLSPSFHRRPDPGHRQVSTSIPAPPPRSRSLYRISAAHGSSAPVKTGKDYHGEQASLELIDDDRALMRASAASSQPHPTTLSPSQHRHSDSPPLSRNQASIVNFMRPVSRREEKEGSAGPQEPSFLHGGAAAAALLPQGDARSRHFSADAVEQRPSNPPRLRSHSRGRPKAVSNRVSNDSAYTFPPPRPNSR
jgi:hypothetical protein